MLKSVNIRVFFEEINKFRFGKIEKKPLKTELVFKEVEGINNSFRSSNIRQIVIKNYNVINVREKNSIGNIECQNSKRYVYNWKNRGKRRSLRDPNRGQIE